MKTERVLEHRLRRMKVYRPQVTKIDTGWMIESYPLDVRTKDTDNGGTLLTLYDWSLKTPPWIVEEETVAADGDVPTCIGLLILRHHKEAYERFRARMAAAPWRRLRMITTPKWIN